MLGNNAPTIHECVARPALPSRFDLAGTNKYHDTHDTRAASLITRLDRVSSLPMRPCARRARGPPHCARSISTVLPPTASAATKRHILSYLPHTRVPRCPTGRDRRHRQHGAGRSPGPLLPGGDHEAHPAPRLLRLQRRRVVVGLWRHRQVTLYAIHSTHSPPGGHHSTHKTYTFHTYSTHTRQARKGGGAGQGTDGRGGRPPGDAHLPRRDHVPQRDALPRGGPAQAAPARGRGPSGLHPARRPQRRQHPRRRPPQPVDHRLFSAFSMRSPLIPACALTAHTTHDTHMAHTHTRHTHTHTHTHGTHDSTRDRGMC